MVSSEPFNSRAMLLPLEAFAALPFMFRWIDPCVGFMKTGRNYVDHGVCAAKKENSLCLYFGVLFYALDLLLLVADKR